MRRPLRADSSLVALPPILRSATSLLGHQPIVQERRFVELTCGLCSLGDERTVDAATCVGPSEGGQYRAINIYRIRIELRRFVEVPKNPIRANEYGYTCVGDADVRTTDIDN